MLTDQQEVHDHHQHSFPLSSDGETSDVGRKSRFEGAYEFESANGQTKQRTDEERIGSGGYDESEWVYERNERESSNTGRSRGMVNKDGYDNEKDKRTVGGVHRHDLDLGRGHNVIRNTRMRVQKEGVGHPPISKKDSPPAHISSPINPIIGSAKLRNEKDERALRPHATAKNLQAPKQVKHSVSKKNIGGKFSYALFKNRVVCIV